MGDFVKHTTNGKDQSSPSTSKTVSSQRKSMIGAKRKVEWLTAKGCKETFWNNRNLCHVWGGGNMGAYVCQNLLNYSLKHMFINYSSISLI